MQPARRSIAILLFLFTLYPSISMLASDQQPLYDLPRLDDALVVDGAADDWSTNGFRIEAWAEDAAPPFDTALFSATARLGWTTRGLAALLELRSTLPWVEAEDVANAYYADSVELFVRTGTESQALVQAVLTPGLAPGQPALRNLVLDYRGNKDAWVGIPTAVVAARRPTADGCVIEALLPWEQLRFNAAPNALCECLIKINKIIPGRGRRQFSWQRSGTDTYQPLRLADRASAPVTTAAWLARDGFERFAFCAVAPRAAKGDIFSVRDDVHEIVRTPLTIDGERASAAVWLPIPDAGVHTAVLSLGGRELARVPVPNVRLAARRELERAARRTRRWRSEEKIAGTQVKAPVVLTSDILPEIESISPAIARIVGVERTDVRWFGADFSPVTRAEQPGRYGAVVTLHCTNDEPVVHYLTCVRLPDDLSTFDSIATVVQQLAGTNAPDPQAAFLLSLLQQRARNVLQSERNLAILLAAAMEAAADGGNLRPLTRDRAWWHALRTRLGCATTYTWFKHLPKGYDTDPEKRWPAILYLHGSGGELPRDYSTLAQRTADKDLIGWAKGTNLRFVIYALQSFGAWEPSAVIDALRGMLAEDRIDPDRVTVMGFSMGGIGAWECAIDYPEWFAAAVPIAGAGDRAFDCSTLAGRVPVWVFNGDADTVTRLVDAERSVAALKAAGGDVRLTVIEGGDHGASQNGTFNTRELWDWLQAQRRRTHAP